MQTLAVVNEKGGVGKTTTAVNVAAALGDLGLRLLVVDLDPQAAASAFSFSPRPSQGSTLRAAFSVARTNSNSTVRSIGSNWRRAGAFGSCCRRRRAVGVS